MSEEHERVLAALERAVELPTDADNLLRAWEAAEHAGLDRSRLPATEIGWVSALSPRAPRGRP